MKKILIVEDEVSIAQLERDYLQVSGYDVEVATEGDKGLQLVMHESYDLVILDLMLPGVDGYEICRRLRSISEVPVIVVSAKKEDSDKIRVFGLGADDFMTKPFSPSELVARVNAHMSRYDRLVNAAKDRRNEDILEVRDLSFDRAARRVLLYGKEITLTQKEYDLLLFLAEHPNTVFTKEDLFRNIWGFEVVGDTATVTVHVKKIREKIEIDPTKPKYIETIWGVGYRFHR
ncbi:MAG: response regulator transcription factor [Lachnospiraceae bacterium]|nr:response regulator transcription factor [Lachnospiraceae bacterium]